ncbi:MAG TPA: radical SAM/SPASM domain-containing protein [Candidatus Binataceae bacterium]|nr:radical SAM/SPASM domain-containing protein [Candidatus Binataceae bacterium]
MEIQVVSSSSAHRIGDRIDRPIRNNSLQRGAGTRLGRSIKTALDLIRGRRLLSPDAVQNPLEELAKYFFFGLLRPRFPLNIQIETSSRCNAQCGFCPYPVVSKTQPQGLMADDLWRRLIDEILAHHTWWVHFYYLNEPLLDSRLPQIIRSVTSRRRGRLPKTKINTNGTLLDEERARALLEAGLDQITVSIPSLDPTIYSRHMGGLKLDKVIANVERLNEMRRTMGARLDLRVTATVTDHTADSIYRQRAFWRARGIRFEQVRMANQADREIETNGLSARYVASRFCAVPFWRMYITWNGDTVLCCCDTSHTVTPGNVARSSIAEVWNSPAYRALHRARWSGIDLPQVCRDCRVSVPD